VQFINEEGGKQVFSDILDLEVIHLYKVLFNDTNNSSVLSLV